MNSGRHFLVSNIDMKQEQPSFSHALKLVKQLIHVIGDDPAREGLVETPERVIRSYRELFSGYGKSPADILKTFTEGACDEIVILKNCEMYSSCEHHLLPFAGRAHVAYIPDGRVIGISKLARLVEIFSRRLQIQERICQQVTEALDTYLKPLGSACIIEASHFCMMCRGVNKQNSVMVTSSLTGEFRNHEVRQELLALIK
jgi:GTP cyclohydrolase I